MVELQFAIKFSNLWIFSGRLQISAGLVGALIYFGAHGLR